MLRPANRNSLVGLLALVLCVGRSVVGSLRLEVGLVGMGLLDISACE